MKTIILILFVLLVLMSIVAVLALVAGVLGRLRRAKARSKRYHQGRVSSDKQAITFDMLAEYYGGLRKAADRRLKLLFEKGLTLKKKGKFPSAIRAFEECLKEKLTPRQQTGFLVTVGNCHFAMGEHDLAKDCYEKADRLSTRANDQKGKLSCLINLGLVSAAHRRWGEAIVSYQQVIRLDQKLGYTPGEAVDLNTLGLLYERRGDLQAAMTQYAASLLILRKLDDKEKLNLVENNVQRVRRLGTGEEMEGSSPKEGTRA
jgi:tetratricopeptide (TPR) repeat protein